jgi:hypothetical protein
MSDESVILLYYRMRVVMLGSPPSLKQTHFVSLQSSHCNVRFSFTVVMLESATLHYTNAPGEGAPFNTCPLIIKRGLKVVLD